MIGHRLRSCHSFVSCSFCQSGTVRLKSFLTSPVRFTYYYTPYLPNNMLYKAAVLAVSASLAGLTSATSCVQSNGNWYCSQVDAITYSNFGKAGSYNRVSYMNDSTGACEFTSTSYSGSIAPFDEEVGGTKCLGKRDTDTCSFPYTSGAHFTSSSSHFTPLHHPLLKRRGTHICTVIRGTPTSMIMPTRISSESAQHPLPAQAPTVPLISQMARHFTLNAASIVREILAWHIHPASPRASTSAPRLVPASM